MPDCQAADAWEAKESHETFRAGAFFGMKAVIPSRREGSCFVVATTSVD
jgi:hypothetical protein